MIYMLAGEVTLHEGTAQTVMGPGDCATFRAGDPVGHCLENTSTSEARYLVIGTRAAKDIVTYPDHDRMVQIDRTSGQRLYTNLAGAPAETPYKV